MNCRVVTKISSCRVNTTSRRGIKQLEPGATLLVAGENPRPPALNDNPGTETSCSRKKSFAFQGKLKKMLLHWRVNFADQNKQQLQEDVCHVPYMTSQYETNL